MSDEAPPSAPAATEGKTEVGSSSPSPAEGGGGSASSAGRSDKLASIVDDPRFKQGLALIKEKKYDEALEFLGRCMEIVVAEDDLALAAAPVYFAYGDALLSKAEDSVDLFGTAVQEAKEKQQAAAKGEVEGEGGDEEQEDDTEEGEGGEEEEEGRGGAAEQADGTEKKAIPEEMQDDLEVAWENLEAARVIYHKHIDEIEKKKLGEVYLRLGDLQKTNGNYQQAIEDYHKSLELYSEVVPEDERIHADLHYSLAVAYIYASGLDEAEATRLKERGLHHYIKCASVFEKLIAKKEKEALESSAATIQDFREIIEELQETVEATKLELKTALSTKAALPLTTVGFGGGGAAASGAAASSSSAAAASSSTSNGFAQQASFPSAAASADAENQAPASVNVVMAVKKKPKAAAAVALTPAAPAAAAEVEGSTATNGTTESMMMTKKRPAPSEGPAEPEESIAKAAKVE